MRDKYFKKKLLSHPKEALKELFKGDIRLSALEHAHVKIIEEKRDEWVIPIPNFVVHSEELSADELKQLAAGVTGGCFDPQGWCSWP